MQNGILNNLSSIDWTLVMSLHSHKRQHTLSPGSPAKSKQRNLTSFITIQSRFVPLFENLTTQEMETDQILDRPNRKPQFFIKSNSNYKNFCDVIKKIIGPEEEEFICKSHINNLKLKTKTLDSYRKYLNYSKKKKLTFTLTN